MTLTLVPASVSARQALRPSGVSGTLTTMFSATWASRCASSIMAAVSVAVTSALTGPGTMAQISRNTAKKSPPDLATSEGLVVTPSTNPVAARSRISSISAVSMKKRMVLRVSPKLP